MAIVLSGSTGIDAGSLPVANTGKISAGAGLSAILNTAGVDRVIVDTSGNVGMGGVANTNQKLYVNLAGDGSNMVAFRSIGATNNPLIAFSVNESTRVSTILASGSTSGILAFAVDNSERMRIDATGNVLVTNSTGGLGYGTGAGGTVTQLTSKGTDVTLNKPTGTIITNGSALAAGATVSFRFFNSVYTNNYDIINFQLLNNANATSYNIWATNNGPGFAFIIHIKNISASSLSDVLQINFSLVKGAQS